MTAVWVISGETVTMRQITERLGISDATARSRLKRARLDSGAVTWESLAEDRRKRTVPAGHPWRADRTGAPTPELPAKDFGRRRAQFGSGGRAR
jgi:hypothetical protein